MIGLIQQYHVRRNEVSHQRQIQFGVHKSFYYQHCKKPEALSSLEILYTPEINTVATKDSQCLLQTIYASNLHGTSC